MTTTTEVTMEILLALLDIFERKSFEAGACEEGSTEHEITKRCEHLFKKDYTLIELDNTNGILSPRYPSRIFIPEYEHGHMTSTITINNSNVFNSSIDNATQQSNTHQNLSSNTECITKSSPTIAPHQQQNYLYYQQHALPQSSTATAASSNSKANTATNTIYEDLYDINKIRELITMAKYARCRQRFAVPVIMYRGKYVCRSATISINAETYGRKVVDYAYDYLNGTNYSERSNQAVDDENNDNVDSLMNQALNEPSPFSYEEVIKSDVQLLNALNVNTIVDLMVEMRKIKYFMAVSSSEKAHPDNHYDDFNLLSLPYPGCEFFKQFSDNNYMAKNLHYNWKQSINDANISLPKLGPATELNINWNDYKSWDVVLITQNYLKACLQCIKEEKSGLLIHCISGWDRTPLFISLVRLSLWADGLIHQSLNALQMTYFTVAYDWYLFGHQLPDRIKRGEDIMVFCFHVLKFIMDEEFSIIEQRKRTKTSSSSGSSVSILKHDVCDDEPLKEDVILGCDQDSNDSFSNSSICDISITDNFFTTATTTTPQGSCNNLAGINPITNRSPNAKRSKTSPISVPGASTTRQRQESTSSNGSWQVVTETGSIDSTINGSFMMRGATQQQDAVNCSNFSENSSNSNNTSSNVLNSCGDSNNPTSSINSRDNLPSTKPMPSLRKQRLSAVRAIFINGYGRTVGLKFKEGSGLSISGFIGTITDQFF